MNQLFLLFIILNLFCLREFAILASMQLYDVHGCDFASMLYHLSLTGVLGSRDCVVKERQGVWCAPLPNEVNDTASF